MRFKEFHNEYTILPLGQRLKIKSGKSQKNIECNNGKYKIYGTGGIIGFTNKYLYDKESVGIGRKGTIDKPFYFNEPFWTVDTLFYSEIKENNVAKYIYYLFQTIPWKKYNTSTGVPSLTSSSIEAIEKGFPLKEEQYKIATFLSFIDKRIQTQIKIIEDLNIQIKLLLDVFFNDINSYDVYKLNELGFIYNGLSGKSKEDFGQGLAFIPYTNIYNNSVVDTNLLQYVKIEENENQNKVLKGDILFTSSSETPYEVGIASIYLSDLDPIYLNSFSLGFRLNGNTINNKYLCYLFQSKYFRKIIFKYSQGSTRYNLNREALLNHKIKFHKREDQDKIVNLLDEINTKIKNESHILKQYEIQKSYFLNNLFI